MTKEKYDWDAIIRDYENGIPRKELSEKYKLPKKCIANKFFRIGIKKFKRNPLSDEQKEKALNLYKSGALPSQIFLEIRAEYKAVVNFIKTKAKKKELLRHGKSGCGLQKISKEEAFEIRKRKQLGDLKNVTYKEIAKEYNVSFDTICDILNYTTHIQDIPPEQLARIKERLKNKD